MGGQSRGGPEGRSRRGVQKGGPEGRSTREVHKGGPEGRSRFFFQSFSLKYVCWWLNLSTYTVGTN